VFRRYRTPSWNQRRRPRRGVAAAELAACLPVVVLIVLATIEACTMIFLRQSLAIAAYEGARSAVQLNAGFADVARSTQAILAERRVNSGSTVVSPSLATVRPGEYVEVTVSAPAASNSIVPISFYLGRTLSASATMMKEF
jgi:Flp pilus assembly protein TadG